MAERLLLMAGCTALMGGVYACAMRAAPGRGFMRVIERFVAGIILCYLCHVALKPFGVSVPQNPLSALTAGFFGLPGVALPTLVAGWM